MTPLKDRDTPLPFVRRWPRLSPGCYEALDGFAADNRANGVPDYCPLPISAATAWLTVHDGLSEREAAAAAAGLLACWAWRRHRVVYRFDDDLADALATQADDPASSDTLPADLLLHLPYPIVYVMAPRLYPDVTGFFFWVEWDMEREEPELRATWLPRDLNGSAINTVLHLLPGKTLHDCCMATAEYTVRFLDDPPAEITDDDLRREYRPILQAVQLVLYLCAVNADVSEPPSAPRPAGPLREKPKEEDKVSRIRSYDVGVRIGAALRRQNGNLSAASAGTGPAKRPHSRRGHWHHYWTGPRDGDRTLILKWLAPTFIHADDAPATSETVIRPVKGENR